MTQFPTDKVLTYLKSRLDSARFKHTIGTCRLARELALKNNVPEGQALVAALLHDAGKGFTRAGMAKYAARYRLTVPQKELVLKFNPSLLHGYVSADIAKRRFGITDRAILSAITEHTVGSANMSTLAKIMYIADAVAFDRRYPGVARLRKLAYSDLNAAVREAMANKLHYVLKKKSWLHPGAVIAWNSMIRSEAK